MKAYITVGISGSGKSTWAENLKHQDGDNSTWVIINRYETRWFLSGKRGWNGPDAYKFFGSMEKKVTEYNHDLICNAGWEGKDIIISDTNLNKKFREDMITTCKNCGYEVIIKEFPISFQEACRRDKERGIYAVGEEVLKKQWEQWVKYHMDKDDGMWDQQKENNEQ